MCVIGEGLEGEKGKRDRCWFPSSIPLAGNSVKRRGWLQVGDNLSRGVSCSPQGLGQCSQVGRTETSLNGPSLPVWYSESVKMLAASLEFECSHAHSDAHSVRSFSTWCACGYVLQDKVQDRSLSLKRVTPINWC